MQYAQQRSSSSNAIGIGLVVVLHLGVGYALLQALAKQEVNRVPPPLHGVIILDPPKVVETPSLPIPTPIEHPILNYRPDVELKITPTPTPVPIIVTTQLPAEHDVTPTKPVEVAAVPETRVGPRPLAGPKLIYPARYLSQGVEGWVDLKCDVDDMGSTSNCSMIDHQGPTGFVDEALDYVRASRYSPATHNGVAVVEKDHRFHIAFKLTDK